VGRPLSSGALSGVSGEITAEPAYIFIKLSDLPSRFSTLILGLFFYSMSD
jgi:hypothetical protein